MSFIESGKYSQANRPKINRLAKMAEYLKVLFPDLKNYRLQMTGALLAILMSAATVLVFGWGLKVLVDKGFSDHSGHTLNVALGVMLGIIILMAATSYARFSLVYWTAEKLIADLRKRIYSHILHLDPSYFETHKTGEQVSRINTDTTVLKMVATTNLPMGTRHILTIAGGII
ncbi:MAG: hypothetical protein KGQ70_09255, partial [Alphaproteobacteria bacterium]|nr:hypothetical protein [Alphaproteobacteria bacterium]